MALRRLAGNLILLRPLGSLSVAPKLSFNTKAEEPTTGKTNSDSDKQEVVSNRYFTAALRPKEGWEITDDAEAVHIKAGMPGLGKADFDVTYTDYSLVGIKSDTETRTAVLSRNQLMVDEMVAELNNGVLHLTVPKVKPEDKKDYVHVPVHEVN